MQTTEKAQETSAGYKLKLLFTTVLASLGLTMAAQQPNPNEPDEKTVATDSTKTKEITTVATDTIPPKTYVTKKLDFSKGTATTKKIAEDSKKETAEAEKSLWEAEKSLWEAEKSLWEAEKSLW